MRRDGLGLATVTLRHVQTVRRGGRVWRYLRVPGQPRIRLPDLPPDDPAFLAAYAAALAAGPAPATRGAPGSIAAAVEAFLRSPAHAAHSAGYRRILRRHLDAIRGTGGAAMIRHLRADHIQADLRPLTPVQARDRMKAWRALCAHALDAGLIAADPSQGVRRPRPLRSTPHPPWTADEIARFRARWPLGTAPRAAMELLYWTGARISDAVTLGPGMVRDGVLTFTQTKTGDPAHVPWTSPLPGWAAPMAADRATMHAALAARGGGHMLFLPARGKARSVAGLGNLIARAAAAAGIAGRSAHGLRVARAVALAEAGANPLQIGAWTGHHSLSEVAHYTVAAERRLAVLGTKRGRRAVNSPKPAVNSLARD